MHYKNNRNNRQDSRRVYRIEWRCCHLASILQVKLSINIEQTFYPYFRKKENGKRKTNPYISINKNTKKWWKRQKIQGKNTEIRRKYMKRKYGVF